jgi:hypothetical protein
MKIFSIILLVSMSFSSQLTFATGVEQTLKFNESYVSPITKSSNDAMFAANEQLRKILGASKISIPSTWRLVSVVPKGQGYVMFFQDKDATVYSVGIDASGALSGNSDYLVIPAR